MAADVPPIDAASVGLGDSETNNLHEELALRALDADAVAKENINREAEQRHILRIWSVVVASFIILLFVIVIFHVLLNITNSAFANLAPLLQVALFVAPIVSLTTLSVALLLAAFRGSAGIDERAMTSVATAGMGLTGS